MAQIADSLSRAHNDKRRSVETIVDSTQDTQSTTRWAALKEHQKAIISSTLQTMIRL